MAQAGARLPLRLLKETLSEWWEDDASQLAASLAFYTVFSVAPLLITAVAVASHFFSREEARQEILLRVGGYIGPAGVNVMQNVMNQARDSSPFATLISLGTILLGASIVFAHLQEALNQVWEVAARPGKRIRQYLQMRILSFLMVLMVGFLLLTSIALGVILSAARNAVSAYLDVSPILFQSLNYAFAFLLMTLSFALVFRVLPDVSIDWKDVWIGAAATSLLFAFGRYLIGLYLERSTLGSAYGVAGSFVVLLIWVYYSAQVFFLGAEFTQVYARSRGREIHPSAHAVRVRRRTLITEDENPTAKT